MATYQADLEGNPIDLGLAADLDQVSDRAHVVKIDGGFRLQSPALENLAAAALVATAERELETINGIAAVVYAAYEPIGLTGCFHSDDGTILVNAAPMEVRIRFHATSEVVGKPPEPDAPVRHAADLHPDFARAIGFMAAETLDWVALWKVYDVVRVGTTEGLPATQTHIVDRGWATRAELNSFMTSANDPAVSGGAARHGATTRAQPQGVQPMDLSEARALMRRILIAWATEITGAQ